METIKVKKKAGRISPTLMGDYDDTTTYRRLDWVYYGGTSYICKKNNTIGIKPSTLERWQKMIELPTELNMIFEEATTRENITSGEKLSVILGKIKRCISDIKAVAFTGSYNDLSDTPKSLKNPNALNINFNGASEASYDGSATKEINVTPAAINAVNTSTILTTKEQISANTNAANVTGALVAKSIMADITQINGSLSEKAVTKSGHLQGVSGSVATINLAPFTNYLFFAYTYVYFIQTYSRSFEYYGIIPAPEDFITLNNVDGLNLKIIKNIGSSFYATILNMGKNNYNFLDT